MHLAYFDDSDTKLKPHKWQVMSAVLIEDKGFKLAETGMSTIVQDLIAPDRLDKFEEFHACELYGGYGVFDGIDQAVRFDAIWRLIAIIHGLNLPILYGAVDLSGLQKQFYASADPQDICFRICLKGMLEWVENRINERIDSRLEPTGGIIAADSDKLHESVFYSMMEELVMLIMDECDKKVKETLHRSFRELRPPCIRRFNFNNLHDDMYFGDSRYSIGIQLADLCSYFIARHLEGDAEIDGFYQAIEQHIVHFQIYPSEPGGPQVTPAASVPEATSNLSALLEIMNTTGDSGEPKEVTDGK